MIVLEVILVFFIFIFSIGTIIQLGEEIPNSFCRDHNKIMRDVPVVDGSYTGKFRVTITWTDGKEPLFIRKFWDYVSSGFKYWPKHD